MTHSNATIQKTADVKSNSIGEMTTIWQYSVVLPGAKIGSNVEIYAHCFIENDVIIGDRVTIKSGVHIRDGVRLEDDVHIEPNVTFSNVALPIPNDHHRVSALTVVEKGAVIGGGAVLLTGLTVGQGSIVSAGAIVTKSVPPYAIVDGSPARIVGYVDSATTSNYGKSIDPLTTDPLVEGVKSVGVGSVALHRLKVVQDMRGDLSVGEFSREIPFEPKRYFTVFNVPSEETRGEHAHHQCQQFLICIKGSCAVVVDDGISRCEIPLTSPGVGLYLPPLTWGIQYKYSNDAILLVFASDYYEAEDYIRSYTEFLKITKKREKNAQAD